MAAVNYVLPPTSALEIHDARAAEKWKKFKRAWDNYVLATKLTTKSEALQVAMLLTVIGEEVREDRSARIFPEPALSCSHRHRVPNQRKLRRSHGSTYRSRGNDLTSAYKKLVRAMTNTVPSYVSWPRAVILKQSHRMGYCGTNWCLASVMLKPENVSFESLN